MCFPCQTAFFWIIAMVVLSLACSSSSTQNPVQPESEQSVEAAKIQRIWEERVEGYRAKLRASKEVTKGSVREEFEILENLLQSAPERVVDSELRRIVHSDKPYEQMSAYERTFLQLHVDKYIREASREKLVGIISNKCPRNIGYAPIELALTNGKRPEDLITLFEAYAKASDQRSKEQIVRILKNVFPELQKRYENEAEFVEASKQWLLANQAKLRINTSYSPYSIIPERKRFFLP